VRHEVQQLVDAELFGPESLASGLFFEVGGGADAELFVEDQRRVEERREGG